MKKRGYDYIGYSKQCFQESYTSVGFDSGSFSMSIALAGFSVSVPITNMSGRASMSGSVGLSSGDLSKVTSGTHFSCLRMRAYSTYATYSSRIYDNASGQLLTTTNYNHTYTYKNNKSPGIDYYLVARTPTQCSEIKRNSYFGTNAEKSGNSTTWRTVPANSSMLP